jgi:hypothetical protein
MNHTFDIPKGYSQTRSPSQATTLRPFECEVCGWCGHVELAWDGQHFSHVSNCPDHTGTPLDEWDNGRPNTKGTSPQALRTA